VDVNRAYSTIREQGYDYEIDLKDYPTIESIAFLPASSGSSETIDFFQSSSKDFSIRPVYENGTLSGFLKFNIEQTIHPSFEKVRTAANVILVLTSVLIMGVMLYIKYQIINPFNQIMDLPMELSKGTLTGGIPESKSRYLGTFIWGLNMLRDTLEKHKRNELKLLKEKKTMILSISHDIKTPLSAIKLYTRSLLDNLYTDQEKRTGALKGIAQKTVEIENFVGDIIKASNEDFLSFDVPISSFYLEELIQLINQYYQEKLTLIQTEFNIASYSNRLLYGNLDRAQEVLQNIIENAIKYGDGKLIEVHFTQEEGFQLITISNTGITLPDQEVVHIFDSFWRGSNSGGHDGSGLGLYICKQLLNKMEGDIFADIRDGKMHVTVVLKII